MRIRIETEGVREAVARPPRLTPSTAVRRSPSPKRGRRG